MEAFVDNDDTDLRTLLAVDPMSREAQELAAKQRISTGEERARVASQVTTLAATGFVVMPDLLGADKLAEVANAMDRLHGVIPLGGDSFSGTRSQRIFNILERLPCVHALAMHPTVVRDAGE